MQKTIEDFAARPTLVLGAAVAVGLSLFQLYTAGFITLNLFYQRGIHLTLMMVLALLLFPVFGRGRSRGVAGWLIDGALIAATAYVGFYLTWYLDEIINRAGFWTRTDVVVGAAGVLILLETARRVVGLAITLIASAFILYAAAGQRGGLPFLADYMPGILAHRGYDVDRIVAQLFLGQEGVFGVPLGVAATYVFIFILFGAFLEVTGAGQFFMDLAYAATGRRRGGPAKAAVVSSAMMGSISGSAIANVVTTGAFTIPLMKRLGYKPREAAGIEAASSTGGQIMPPIMGAGAFLIAEYTQTPYIEIVKLSILPAVMYFAVVYLFVDIMAAKAGLKGLSASELPGVREVLHRGWHFLLPLAVLVYFLVLSISPTRVGAIAIASVVAVALGRWLWNRMSHSRGANSGTSALSAAGALREGAYRLFVALELGARNAIPVSLACAVAGIVVGIVGLTGLGLKFSSLMLTLSMGNIVLALLLVIIASLILGMGLPVTASYIVLVVLTGPALVEQFGIPLLIAHLLVFWYSQDSNVTPPVALAAFAASGIAGSEPMRTSFTAWKVAKGLYLIPLFMVFNPEIIMGGPVPLVIWSVLTAFAALAAFAAALEGYFFTWMNWLSRALLGAGTVAIFWPSIYAEVAGLAVIAATLAANFFAARAGRPSVLPRINSYPGAG
jgi:TRAP transporter 4TM/12TM fusion protein